MFIALGTNFNTTDTAGNVWVGKDLTTYVPQGQSVSVACTESGVAGNCSGYGDDSATIAGVSDAAQMPIYRHAIYGNPYSTPKGDLAVKFSVPPGIYHVTLKFADYNASYEPGVLVQDILANGRKIYRSFDFVTAAGAPQTAVDRTFTVNQTAGVLTLQFNHAANGRPHINAISVVYAGSLPEGQTAISGASAIKGIGVR
jgi:Di-glucose binding within endoplasmic reticulum.